MEKHYVDISTMFQEADDVLFRTILSNKSHVLYTLFVWAARNIILTTNQKPQ